MLSFILTTTAAERSEIEAILAGIPHQAYIGQSSGAWCVRIGYGWLQSAHERLRAAHLLVVREPGNAEASNHG